VPVTEMGAGGEVEGVVDEGGGEPASGDTETLLISGADHVSPATAPALKRKERRDTPDFSGGHGSHCTICPEIPHSLCFV